MLSSLATAILEHAPHVSLTTLVMMSVLVSMLVGGNLILVILTLISPAKFARVLVRGLSWAPVHLFFMGGILLGREALTLGCVALSLRALYELFSITRPHIASSITAGAVILTCAHYALLVWTVDTLLSLLFPVVCVIGCVVLLVWYRRHGGGRSLWRASCYLMIATGWLGLIATLAWLPLSTPTWGWVVLLLVATPQLGDLFQYLVGKAIGKRPLAPSLSPTKTWEGAIGGSLLACAIATPYAIEVTSLGVLECVGLTATLCVAGIFGDLLLSWFKRSSGVKDYPLLLPEFGGALDRVDSLTLAAPIYVVMLLATHLIQTSPA